MCKRYGLSGSRSKAAAPDVSLIAAQAPVAVGFEPTSTLLYWILASNGAFSKCVMNSERVKPED